MMGGVRELLGELDYPMLIVTTAADGDMAGCLVGFHSQCSMDPVRFLVLLSDKNHTYEVACRADLLGVHFPAADQRELAAWFGSRTGDEVDKFEHIDHVLGPDGVPLIEQCPNRFIGRIIDKVAFGDHVGFVLDPVDLERDGAIDHLPFRAVKDVDPGHDP